MFPTRRKHLLVQILTVIAISVVICGCVDSEAITVRKTKLHVQKHELTEDARRGAAPEKTKSHWEFTFQPDIVVEKIKGKEDASGYSGIFKVKKIEVHIALPFDLWVSDDASQKAIDHEDGYVKICRRIYRDASHVARKSAIHQIGREIEARGRDEQSARLNAIDIAATEMHAFYKEKIVEPTNRAVAKYRTLTQVGSNDISVDEAISQALEEDSSTSVTKDARMTQ